MILVSDQTQTFVLDDNQRVHNLFEGGDAALCLLHSLFALKLKRLCNDADGQDVHFLGHLRDDWGSSGAGAAAHAGGDEDHLAALDRCSNLVAALLSGFLASFRNASRTASSGQPVTNDNFLAGLGVFQRLCIGIDGDKFHALHAAFNHSVDGVAATAANTYDLYGHFYAIIIVVEFKIRHHLFVPPMFYLQHTRCKLSLKFDFIQSVA